MTRMPRTSSRPNFHRLLSSLLLLSLGAVALAPLISFPRKAYADFPQVASITDSTFASDATSHDVSMPATVAASDLLLVLFTNDGGSTVTTPGGWTQLFTQNESNNRVRASAYSKIASGSEGGTAVDFVTSPGDQAAAQVYRILAAEWYGDISDGLAVGTSIQATAANPDPPSLTPAWGADDTLWIAYIGYSSSAGGSIVGSYPADYTDGSTTSSSASTNGAQVASGRRERNISTEDPGAYTSASSAYAGNTIAVRPAAGGGGGGAEEQLIFLTSGTSWTVPYDWNSSDNTIEVIGGGGGGTSSGNGNSGGGGGAYAKISDLSLTPGGSVAYQVGNGGAVGAAGTDTYFNGASCPAASVCAKAGATGPSGAGGSATSSIGDDKYSGGDGATGNFNNGGGGAGGPNGAGKNGGRGGGSPGTGGGGGGAGGGGSNGSANSGSAGGSGGNNSVGAGGGSGGASGVNGTSGSAGGGGGGGGAAASGGDGGAGSEWDASHGAGGGGGSGGFGLEDGGVGGLYGGGGSDYAAGAKGIIVITYTPPPDSPTNLTTTSITGGVNLSWSAPASTGGSNLETYGIWRATSPFSDTSAATLIASIATTSTSYSDTSVVLRTTYYYRLTATNGTATSSLSNQRVSNSNSGRIIRLGGMRLR